MGELKSPGKSSPERGFNPSTRSCKGATLNNRSEFYNTCRQALEETIHKLKKRRKPVNRVHGTQRSKLGTIQRPESDCLAGTIVH